MSISIGGVSVEVARDGHQEGWTALGSTGRSYGGKLRSAIVAGRGYVRTWRLQTIEYDITDVETLEAQLVGPGPVWVSGAIIDPDGGLYCYAFNVERVYSDTPLTAALTFELQEAVQTTMEAGVVSLVFEEAALVYGGLYDLAAAAGSLSLSFSAATLLLGNPLDAEAGTLSLAFDDADLVWTGGVAAEEGSLSLTFFDASLVYSGS